MGGQVSMATPNDVAAVVAAAPADTSVQVLNLWALVLLTFTNLATVLWNIFSGPSKRNAAELKAQADHVASLDQRVGHLEHAQKDAPKQQDFHELEVNMTELKGVINVLTERLKPLESVSGRMQEWAMELGRK